MCPDFNTSKRRGLDDARQRKNVTVDEMAAVENLPRFRIPQANWRRQMNERESLARVESQQWVVYEGRVLVGRGARREESVF